MEKESPEGWRCLILGSLGVIQQNAGAKIAASTATSVVY